MLKTFEAENYIRKNGSKPKYEEDLGKTENAQQLKLPRT
jgi:hypothetical protein